MGGIEEKLFQKIHSYFSRKKPSREHEARLDDVEKKLQVLASLAAQTRVSIRKSDDHGGFNGSELFLPPSIGVFPSPDLNRKVYLHRALCISESFWADAPQSKPYFQDLYSAWDELKSEKSAPDDTLLWGKPLRAKKESAQKSKINFQDGESKKTGTTLKVEAHFNPKKISLQEAEENPLIHNFEKVKTAEDYQGGNRSFDGNDELIDHADALDELRLSHVIRTNQTTEGFLETDAQLDGTPIETEMDTINGAKTFVYPEWSHQRGTYLKDWCRVLEVEATTPKKAPKAEKNSELKKSLMGLFNQPRVLKGQRNGVDLDPDAYVRWKSLPAAQRDPEPRVYLSKKKLCVDIAIEILVDSSLSTEGFIGQEKILSIIQKQVDLFTDAMDSIGIQTSVSAFRTHTRKECNFLKIKNYRKNWDEGARSRLYSLDPAGYTRIGPALRHSIESIAAEKQRKKIILLFSDAKPTDYDAYEGTHGISDVGRCVLEAKARDIHVHCMAFHHRKSPHLKSIFGANHFDQIQSPKEFKTAFIRLMDRVL